MGGKATTVMMSGEVSTITVPVIPVTLTHPGTTVVTATVANAIFETFTFLGKGTTIITLKDDLTSINKVETRVTETVTVVEPTSTIYNQYIRRSGSHYYSGITGAPLTSTSHEDCRTWGCFPGTICVPLDRCSTDPVPERSFLCPPERCKPAPPVIEPHRYFTGMSLRNVTLQMPYYPIDPTIFGLDDRIWYPIIGQESLGARNGGINMGIHERDRRKLAYRQIPIEEVTGLGVCIEPCHAAVVERQHIGLTAALCSAGGAYREWFTQCLQCTTDTGTQGVDLYHSVIYPAYFAADVDYCRRSLPGIWQVLTSLNTTIATTAVGPIATTETTRLVATKSSPQAVSNSSRLTTTQSKRTTNITIATNTTVSASTISTTTLKTNRTTKMTSQEAVKTTTTQLSFTPQASPVASSTPATTTIFLSRSSSNSKDGRNASTTTMTTTANNQTTSLTTNREVPSDESTRTSSPTISITTNTLRDSTITYITYTTTARGSRLTTEILSGTSYSSTSAITRTIVTTVGAGSTPNPSNENYSTWVPIAIQSGNAAELLYHGSPRHHHIITYLLVSIIINLW